MRTEKNQENIHKPEWSYISGVKILSTGIWGIPARTSCSVVKPRGPTEVIPHMLSAKKAGANIELGITALTMENVSVTYRKRRCRWHPSQHWHQGMFPAAVGCDEKGGYRMVYHSDCVETILRRPARGCGICNVREEREVKLHSKPQEVGRGVWGWSDSFINPIRTPPLLPSVLGFTVELDFSLLKHCEGQTLLLGARGWFAHNLNGNLYSKLSK